MSSIPAICFFAFVATVASKIIFVNLADWECVSNRLNAAAGRSPKLAALYSELNEIYGGIVSEAEKCGRNEETESAPMRNPFSCMVELLQNMNNLFS